MVAETEPATEVETLEQRVARLTGGKLAVRVSTAADLLDIGLSKTYDLIRTGELPGKKVGKVTRVPVTGILKLLS